MPNDALAQAEEILRRHLPQRRGEPVRLLGEGWDYTCVLVGVDLVLRISRARTPRRRLLQEAAVTRLLEGSLPLLVPQLRLLGGGQAVAAAYPYVAGNQAQIAGGNLALLGHFLRSLHAVPRSAVMAAGIGWVQWSGGGRAWEDGLRRYLAKANQAVSPHLPWERRKALARRVGAFLSDPDNFRFAARLIHADLSPEHLLADPRSGVLQAVIDFGDAGLGDPAYDVRPEWTPYYRPVGKTFRARQRFYRFLEPLHGALYAVETVDEAALRSALGRLDL